MSDDEFPPIETGKQKAEYSRECKDENRNFRRAGFFKKVFSVGRYEEGGKERETADGEENYLLAADVLVAMKTRINRIDSEERKDIYFSYFIRHFHMPYTSILGPCKQAGFVL